MNASDIEDTENTAKAEKVETGKEASDAAKDTAEAVGSEAAEQETAAEPEAAVEQEATCEPDEGAEATPGAAADEEKKDEKPKGPDWKDLYARTLADFENFRKRTERDREDLAKFAAKEILKDLLATADNLALALEKAKDKDEPFVKGVQLVYDGFLKVLADHGATPIDSVGEPFDTSFHEALTQQPSDTVPEGHVMTEFKRGWLLNGKLLRAAQVVVSSGKPE